VNSQLQFFIHKDSDALRIELAGSLSGPDIESLIDAWQGAVSTDSRRPAIADISYATDADEDGRALLMRWHRSGVRIIARSPQTWAARTPQSWALVQPLVSEPVDVAHPRRRWLGSFTSRSNR
jgi:hypothetical protein